MIRVKKNRTRRAKRIPETLGNGICGVWPYVASLALNAFIHVGLFFLYGMSIQSLFRLLVSFIFFIYPFYYLADVLWSLRPSVCDILSGVTRINRKHYMNVARSEVERSSYFPVTISIPVYTEENAVIFETIRGSIAAAKRYQQYSGLSANIIVSDDGLAPLLGGICSRDIADDLMHRFSSNSNQLSEKEMKAAERIAFYRRSGVAFVVRPAQGRAGLFKKASNLNYTIRLGNATVQGNALGDLTRAGGTFEGGYAEGDIETREIILLLDKDSGVKEKIIEAVVPEFASDDKLAYIQCATVAINMSDNYFSYATGHQTNNLFHNIWPCKALQGFFVPLVGHNAFIRKSILEKSGLWSENKVSEDFDKAIGFYNMGYHGKYAQLNGLEFTEYVSRTFAEETGKQHRYSYGLFEMIFDGTIVLGRTRKCDAFYMFLYFFSIINEIMLIPTVLLECYFGNIHLLWAGFITCNVFFVILPCIRGFVMRSRFPEDKIEKFPHTVIVAISFVGHAFSMLAGACRYLANKIKLNMKSFPSTSVDELDGRFTEGLRLIAEFVRKNKGFLLIAVLCIDRGLFLITRKGIAPVTIIIYCYILFGTVLAPVLLTPQLFSGIRPRTIVQLAPINSSQRIISLAPSRAKGREPMQVSSPKIIPSSNPEYFGSDVNSFLNAYNATLNETISCEGMPEALIHRYAFESCIRKDENGKKEIYLLRRKQDGIKAILRVTKDYPEEDALEEAKILSSFDHPGIPKVFETYEKDGKKYIVREYIAGRSLYDIVRAKGVLSVKDIFGVVLKITEILRYLHAQTPPVIHRDIKPQNIIVGYDGSIHLIDFGISRVHKEESTQDTSVVLTLDYAPPEQFGFEQTSPLTDIYSLGVVILFMATGHVSRSDLEAKVVNNRLRNLIERCIAFDPKSRIQSVEVIDHFITREKSHRRTSRRIAIAACLVTMMVLPSLLSYGIGNKLGKDKGVQVGYKSGFDIGYVDGYEDAPIVKIGDMDEDATRGNRPGNMAIEGGAFAAQGADSVFYVLDGDIIKMSEKGTEGDVIVRGQNAQALSYMNGWLYYSSGSKIMQTNIYTLDRDILREDMVGKLHLVNSKYYIAGEDGFYSLDIADGSIKKRSDLFPCRWVNVDKDKIVFVYGKDSALYSMDINSFKVRRLLDGECKNVCLFEGDIYCSTVKNGHEELIRVDANTGNTTFIAELSASMINVTGRGIYYIDRFEETIHLCSLDGQYRSKITSSRAIDFNIAGEWIFYHNDDDGGRLWCVRLDGTNDHQLQKKR